MDAELTKSFAFSASHRSGSRSIGANYIFSISLPALGESAEKEFEGLVQSELISKLHTRDLSDGVNFLKGVEMTDAGLLQAFWGLLSGPLAPHKPRRFALQRDSRTITTLYL